MQSLARAKDILDGTYKSGSRRDKRFSSKDLDYPEEEDKDEEYQSHSNINGDNYNDLSYRSAYNYEKSFSPQRKSENIRPSQEFTDTKMNDHDKKKYIISEEDYILLQKLKKQNPDAFTDNDFSVETYHKDTLADQRKLYPSRGQPRKIYESDIDMHHHRNYSRHTTNSTELINRSNEYKGNNKDENDRASTPTLPRRSYKVDSHACLNNRRRNKSISEFEGESRNKDVEREQVNKKDNILSERDHNHHFFQFSDLKIKNREKINYEKLENMIRITDERSRSPIVLSNNEQDSDSDSNYISDTDSNSNLDLDSDSNKGKKIPPPLPKKASRVVSNDMKSALDNRNMDPLQSEAKIKPEVPPKHRSSSKISNTEPISLLNSKKVPPPVVSRGAKSASKSIDTLETTKLPHTPSKYNNVEDTNESNINSSSPLPPVNRKSKPIGFMDSLSKNGLTNASKKSTNKTTSPILKPSSHPDFLESMNNNEKSSKIMSSTNVSPLRTNKYDYLDSLQKKEPHSSQSNLSSPTKTTTPSRKIPRSDSFITSAVASSKNPDTLEDNSLKPELPSKPKNLRKIDGSKRIDKPKEELTTLEKEFSSMTLKSVDKNPPKPPPKKNDLLLPKLRSIERANTKGKSLTPNTDKMEEQIVLKKTAPNVSKRKPTLPEALQKANHLKKSVNSLVESKDSYTSKELEETINKRSALKSPPIVPERKISMPEALKKAQLLKEKKKIANESQARDDIFKETSNVPKNTFELKKAATMESLEAVLMAQRMHGKNSTSSRSSVTKSDSNNSSSSTSSGNSPLFDNSTKYSSSTSSTTELDKNCTKPLRSLTKNRARGPKRHLPSGIK
ncbi:hypothetical protein TBLA_0J00170 [Henningerozyma blattae CBS 6284]|uniref:Uncharacterized protein n=1 Tax=Henningerozyma blattae (strain ATCC 34711 / CBS 6284 / DSM 70876 / NBRC 10599 / NRRL Y-10934 / UCD 77-7) TaxID=1071380 RepID=I2H9G6_HENB6|nr:hypothetical protein TBLA_0J00170 [Tetrapisispora blattae CBS 6284]CCH63018.1 hypothetical protein TBLA_0J00170 [Tetrapisispora blattae CBS 6284]